jgi:hypothetical protein
VSEGLFAVAALLLVVVVLLSPVIVVAGATLGFVMASGLWH